MIDAATYTTERAICDKAEAYARAAMAKRSPRCNFLTAEEAAHPDYAACDNAMRGRVEQYELRTNPPERFVAYIGEIKRNGMGCDRAIGQSHALTTWMGDELGNVVLGSGWRVQSAFGPRMYQVSAWMAGREYTGRSYGPGMCVLLRETAASKRKRGA